METSPTSLPCDGCGLPASPQHIADRLRRLELATRFRPVHMNVLFVALAPPLRPEDDFYGPAESKEFFTSFLEGLDIPAAIDGTGAGEGAQPADSARLAEFQRRGYFLTNLFECPIPAGVESAESTIARLAPTLIRRIRFNYKPKLIAPIGEELAPLVELLRQAGVGPVVTLEKGQILPAPGTGAREWKELFQRAVAAAAPSQNLPSGYDRIPLTSAERKLGAGGTS